MMTPHLQEVHPVLPVRDVVTSIGYYVHSLGFTLAFADDPKDPKYAGVRRDGVEVHLQWHSEQEWEDMTASSLRFVTTQIERLFETYANAGVYHQNTDLRVTTWGTREFGFFDPDRNGLTFYENLT